MEWQKILVATDLSEPADLAVLEAHARAGSGAALLVCHVMASWQRANALFPQFNQPQAEAATAREQLVRETIADRVARLTGRDPEQYSIAIEEGNEPTAIVRLAESWGADVVVLGNRGATGLSRILLGTVAEKVARVAHCPVLITRPRPGTRCIVAGTDFSDPSLPALAAACEEARRIGGHVVFVHSLELPFAIPGGPLVEWAIQPSDITSVSGDAMRRLQDVLAAQGIGGECRVVQEQAGTALVREAEAVGADLLVVGTHGRTGIDRVLLGSVAEAVIRLAPCSVLVVRLGAREPGV
jgi:nucleotide-binding universal stress UspA family protein